MLDEGFWAEVKIAGEHLRLFSERSPQGPHASVYNVTAKIWIAPSEPVDNLEDGKDRAETYAKAYLRNAGYCDLPPLEWKKARSV
jgi:hypothetical protein